MLQNGRSSDSSIRWNFPRPQDWGRCLTSFPHPAESSPLFSACSFKPLCFAFLPMLPCSLGDRPASLVETISWIYGSDKFHFYCILCRMVSHHPPPSRVPWHMMAALSAPVEWGQTCEQGPGTGGATQGQMATWWGTWPGGISLCSSLFLQQWTFVEHVL